MSDIAACAIDETCTEIFAFGLEVIFLVGSGSQFGGLLGQQLLLLIESALTRAEASLSGQAVNLYNLVRRIVMVSFLAQVLFHS